MGCAPSFESLNRHHGQLVCSTGWGEDSDLEHEARVLAALDDALEPRLYVDALTERDLLALLGDRGAAIHARVMILRMVFEVHDSDLESVQPWLSLEAGGTSLPRIADLREELAELTGETLPEDRTVEPSEFAKDLHDLASGLQVTAKVGGLLLRMATLGIVPFDDFVPDAPREPEARTYQPARSALRRSRAPVERAEHPSYRALSFMRSCTSA